MPPARATAATRTSEAMIATFGKPDAVTGLAATTVMSDEVVTAMPSSSTTVRWTVYVPGYAYRWVNVEPSPTAPSPSCQTWRTIVPSGSELRLALNNTAPPTNGREGVKARTANGDFGGTTEIVRWKDAVALWSSQTTNVTEYVPVAPK